MTRLVILLLFFVPILFSCESEEARKEREAKERAEKLENSLEELGKNLENVGKNLGETVTDGINEAMTEVNNSLKNLEINDENGEHIEPVSHREIKQYMPDKFAGIEQSDYSGETNGFGNYKVSVSQAKFQEDNTTIKLDITDTGGLSTLIAASIASWANIEIDKESRNGYERTLDWEGYKAYEKYSNKRNAGSFSFIVNNRILVNCEFRGIDIKTIKRALEDLPLRQLERL